MSNAARRILLIPTVAVILMLFSCAQDSGRQAGVKDAPARSAATSGAAWNQIRVGMRHTEVLTLLGRPLDAQVSAARTTYHYAPDGQGAYVIFDTPSMRVESWQRGD